MRFAICLACLVVTAAPAGAVAPPRPSTHMCPTAVSAQRDRDHDRMFAALAHDDTDDTWAAWIAFAGLGLAALSARRAIRI